MTAVCVTQTFVRACLLLRDSSDCCHGFLRLPHEFYWFYYSIFSKARSLENAAIALWQNYLFLLLTHMYTYTFQFAPITNSIPILLANSWEYLNAKATSLNLGNNLPHGSLHSILMHNRWAFTTKRLCYLCVHVMSSHAEVVFNYSYLHRWQQWLWKSATWWIKYVLHPYSVFELIIYNIFRS